MGYGDSNEDGWIDFVEFFALLVSDDADVQRYLRAPLISFKESFNIFDTDFDGVVTAEEFMRGLRTLGWQENEEEEHEVTSYSAWVVGDVWCVLYS